MAQILVRDLAPETVQELKRRAKEQGRSLQSQAKLILTQVADSPKVDMRVARELCKKYRSRFGARRFSDSARLIREARDR